MTLRQILFREDTGALSPLYNNIYTVLLTVIYVKIGFEFASWIRRRGRRIISRMCVYMSLSSIIIFWPLYDTSNWSWRLNVLVPSAVATRLLYKGLLLKDPHDEDVNIMSRTSSPSELVYGPLQLNLLLMYLGINHFMTSEAAVMIAAVGLGDSIAAWFGASFGRHFYRMPLSRSKTMEGSVCGVFLGSILGTYLNLWCLGLPLLPLRIVLAYAAVAAVAEGTSLSNVDNLVIPLVLHFSFDRVSRWLPA